MSSLVEKTKARLQEHRFTTLLSDAPQSGIYLFFSFDLVNSTKFKAANPTLWPVVMTRFYELVTSALSTRVPSVILWKYAGDEVLFYKRVTAPNDVHLSLLAAYDAMKATIESLHNGHPQTRELLSVKAAAWVALAESIRPGEIEQTKPTYRNIVIPSGRPSAPGEREFLGPDIDAGFRMAKLSTRRRLVVSAHLAWLLFKQRDECTRVETKLRIVGFEPLKDVWDGRQYPIIWFENDWDSIRDTFLYDEHLNSAIVKRIIQAPEEIGGLALVDKIFSDLGKEAEVESLLSALISPCPEVDADQVEIDIPREKYSEVHCVAVCFARDGRVLIAKRPSSKRRFPNAFEFGCGQLKLGESFAECLRRSYKDDFGIALSVEDHPIPIRTYTIEDAQEHRRIPGIIFVADIDNPDLAMTNFSREKHSEIRWVDPEAFKPAEGEACVPDFEATLTDAVRARSGV